MNTKETYPKPCETCGTIFTPKPYRQDVSRFCCVSCRLKGQAKGWSKSRIATHDEIIRAREVIECAKQMCMPQIKTIGDSIGDGIPDHFRIT